MTDNRPVFVYIIASGDYVKIGFSVNPETRLKGILTGMSEKPHLAATRKFDDRATARYVESIMHWRFRECRTHGEWFRVTVKEARAALMRSRTKPPTPFEASQIIAGIFNAQRETPSLVEKII